MHGEIAKDGNRELCAGDEADKVSKKPSFRVCGEYGCLCSWILMLEMREPGIEVGLDSFLEGY